MSLIFLDFDDGSGEVIEFNEQELEEVKDEKL